MSLRLGELQIATIISDWVGLGIMIFLVGCHSQDWKWPGAEDNHTCQSPIFGLFLLARLVPPEQCTYLKRPAQKSLGVVGKLTIRVGERAEDTCCFRDPIFGLWFWVRWLPPQRTDKLSMPCIS